MRWSALVLAACAAAAEEPQPVQVMFNAKGGIELGADPGRTYAAHESVRFAYGGALLSCEHLSYAFRDRPLQRFIKSARIEAGAGPDARVVVDTTACTLPQVAFRGRLSPRLIDVQPLPPDDGQPGVLRWTMLMEEVGEFRARIRNQTGTWVPYAGWAVRIELTIVAGTDASGDARLTDLVMHGVPATGTDDGRPARLIRPAPAAVDLPLDELVAAPIGTVLARVSSSRFTVKFDETGALRTIHGGQDTATDGEAGELYGKSRQP